MAITVKPPAATPVLVLPVSIFENVRPSNSTPPASLLFGSSHTISGISAGRVANLWNDTRCEPGENLQMGKMGNSTRASHVRREDENKRSKTKYNHGSEWLNHERLHYNGSGALALHRMESKEATGER